jgi:drug/metabolite transporter (DMT)-like permease
VALSANYLPALYSLTAVGVWGTSDFLGGLGTRRANTFLFTSFVHASGMILAGVAAFAAGRPFPSARPVLWALAAGALGGIALAFFYRALGRGQMGLIAPVAAVLSATIPAVFTAFTDGLPGPRHLLGFLLAGVGVWLISRTESGGTRPEGLLTAVFCGCGFAGFYLCVHQATAGDALWVSVVSRSASLAVTLVFVLVVGKLGTLPRTILGIAIVAGILDISGSAVFVRAAQIGRLDAAVFLSSLYPAVTVLLARVFLHEHFSRARTLGMLAALVSVPMIAG